ncbi:hypothetical protein LCGC14_2918500 [marine sediment metagenome]|uniref:Uncharacterized protein n=1 Tax=marine sediment metagenome TaxID=412755 RepID=A0A0F8YBE5_9ZZZZ|nr:hypothetical protein [Candidatus Pacearchaeota archaeon]
MPSRTENIRKEKIDSIAATINAKLSDFKANKPGKIAYKDFVIAAAYNKNVSLRTAREYIEIAMSRTKAEKKGEYIVRK